MEEQICGKFILTDAWNQRSEGLVGEDIVIDTTIERIFEISVELYLVISSLQAIFWCEICDRITKTYLFKFLL